MRIAILAGREHKRLGDLAAVSEGPAAIALSKGGAPKQYSHVDPNEDAALFAIGECGLIAAVADGHNGADAAEQAMQFIAEHVAEDWTSSTASARDDWERAGEELLANLNATILETARAQKLPPAQTTFSLALVRPQDDFLLCVSMGDSHVFRVADGNAVDCGWQGVHPGNEAHARTYFLGHELPTKRSFSAMITVQRQPLGRIDAVVLATDGLSEAGIGVEDPAAVVAAATQAAASEQPDLRPLHSCKAVARAALESQRNQLAGDNIATAVLWLSPSS